MTFQLYLLPKLKIGLSQNAVFQPCVSALELRSGWPMSNAWLSQRKILPQKFAKRHEKVLFWHTVNFSHVVRVRALVCSFHWRIAYFHVEWLIIALTSVARLLTKWHYGKRNLYDEWNLTFSLMHIHMLINSFYLILPPISCSWLPWYHNRTWHETACELEIHLTDIVFTISKPIYM